MLPLLGIAVPSAANAQANSSLATALGSAPSSDLEAFYGSRNYRPLWIQDGFVISEAEQLLDILRRADLDGMESGPELAHRLEDTIENARSGDPAQLRRVDLQLSNAWVDYVQTLRRPVDVGMVFLDRSLAPSAPSGSEILRNLADAPSRGRHLEEVSSLNPLYSELREGLASIRQNPQGRSPDAEQRLLINMDRARALPAGRQGKYILVDAATQRLWMYEDGQVRDSMRVIVGKPDEQTPMLAGVIRYSVLNPYWNVPVDLARKRVAPAVLKEGLGYLQTKRYEILSDWTENARVIDPETVDWEAVASGRTELRVRQLPGAGNSMGDMKFAFPNDYGVFLHDTPDKQLFSQADRSLSSGCVRVEDAARLARWMFGTAPRVSSSSPEQKVALAEPVPVYITYLTAGWDGEKLALRRDFYGRDKAPKQLFASNLSATAE
ncbi:MAG: L,D-transpeptidase family protein [Sphingosinicella sp.]|nr:L,D-transpeptidase family protein [Sphingosinicella sp.]